jgi:thiol-disulfide isomerase/thioredoxin
MPKCKVCGKKFDSLSALRDHHNTVHRSTKFAAPKTSNTRNFIVVIVIVIIVVGSLVGYTVYLQFHGNQTTCTSTQTTSLDAALSSYPSIQLLAQDQSTEQVGQPISSTLFQEITSVPNSTLSSVSTSSGITLPSTICGNSLQFNGKPLVFYVGGEFCPYCAAERWSMAVALSKFGTFSNLTYMESWTNENSGYQNISTISFNYANYSSQDISFLGVEEYNQNDQAQHNLTSSEQTLVNEYDSAKSIPFIDIANKYEVVGSQYLPPNLSGLNWDQIGANLNSSVNKVGASVNGAAVTLITAICKADGGLPTSVCGESYANVNLDFSGTPAGVSQLTMMVNVVESDSK